MRSRFVFALLLSVAFRAPVAATAPVLPEDSVYRIPELTLTDQDGKRFTFASLRGEPRLVGMFYTSCRMVCPVEIETLKRVQREYAGKGRVGVVLVSFDPKRDGTAALRDAARKHRVSAPSFRLSRPEQGDEGTLAGVLGIAYRPLPNGTFSHNALVSLLDADGRIVAQFDASGMPDDAFVKTMIELERRADGGR